MDLFVNSLAAFLLNFAIVFVIVRFIYYPQQRDKNYVFTFFAFNTIVFFVMGLSDNTNISVGVGFGLFAIFSILRYRTDAIPIREMTYLFVLIALPVINAILLNAMAYGEFAVANIATLFILYILEKKWGFQYETRKTITYERIDMIKPQNWPLLLADLQDRTGLPIKRIEIGRVDFVRDIAHINIYYDPSELDMTYVRQIASYTVSNYDD
jgi:hypothetical protein